MPRDGRWYFDFERPLDDTDIVYIWVALQHNKVIFRDRQGPFSVGAIRTGDPKYLITTTSTTTTTTTTAKPMPVPDNTLGSTKQCFASITEVAVGDNKHCKGDLLFEENFNELDERRWTNEVRLPLYTTDAEFILYNGTAHIDNGILKIPASLYSGSILSGSIDLGHRYVCMYFPLH